MTHKVKYELPIFSSTFENDPVIKFQDMDVLIELTGADEENQQRHITIVFKRVVCSKHTSASFTVKLYNSFDTIVELIDSEWLNELKSINNEKYEFWCPRHYIVYFDGIGMLQFIAQDVEIRE